MFIFLILSAFFPALPESKWSYGTERQEKHLVFPLMGE